MWATNSGEEIASTPAADGLAFNLSVGHSAIVIALSPGRYVLLHDEVEEAGASAVRCHILR